MNNHLRVSVAGEISLAQRGFVNFSTHRKLLITSSGKSFSAVASISNHKFKLMTGEVLVFTLTRMCQPVLLVDDINIILFLQ